jgi:phenylacetic acid degradation operon negative regulatory protein
MRTTAAVGTVALGKDGAVASAPSSRTRTAPAPSATLAERQGRVGDLLDSTRPVTARAILATALLGAREPRLPVSHLVAVASLFGISAGAARTCLWRMVSNGELTTDKATYALAGRLLERRQQVDAVARTEHTPTDRWDGSWEIAVVSLDRREAMDRHDLRKAAAALHLAEIREGVWTRPDNLDPQRRPESRAVLDQQCIQFRGAESRIAAETVTTLFGLDHWADDARRLVAAMDDEIDAAPFADDDIGATLSYHFTLSIAAVHQLELDPLLPAALLPDDWPAEHLRVSYRTFDDFFQRTMEDALRQPRP